MIHATRSVQQQFNLTRLDKLSVTVLIYSWTLYKTKAYRFVYIDFSKISQFLERFLTEYTDVKVSSDSKLQISSICSIRIRSRKRDIFAYFQPQRKKQLTLRLSNRRWLWREPLIAILITGCLAQGWWVLCLVWNSHYWSRRRDKPITIGWVVTVTGALGTSTTDLISKVDLGFIFWL